MDFNYSDLQRMLLDSAERYISDHYTLEHRRSLRELPSGLDEAAWSQFAELGWLALAIPEELGGLGGSLTDVIVLSAALGTRCVTEPFASTAVLGATILCGADNPDTSLIEGLIAGTVRTALAYDETGERYAYGREREVTCTPSGNGFVLDGQKMFVVDAPSATHLIVAAKRPDGLTLALVENDSDGMSSDNYRLYDGARAADILFEGTAVPADAILASGKKAESLLSLALDRTRIALAGEAVGSMEEELEICSAYLKERHQFGQPIGNFQVLQHIMADMFVATHQARSILYFALSEVDSDAAQRARAVALARLRISEALQLVGRQSIQLHGGYGITDEYEVSHHYRRQMIIDKLYGDTDYYTRLLSAS